MHSTCSRARWRRGRRRRRRGRRPPHGSTRTPCRTPPALRSGGRAWRSAWPARWGRAGPTSTTPVPNGASVTDAAVARATNGSRPGGSLQAAPHRPAPAACRPGPAGGCARGGRASGSRAPRRPGPGRPGAMARSVRKAVIPRRKAAQRSRPAVSWHRGWCRVGEQGGERRLLAARGPPRCRAAAAAIISRLIWRVAWGGNDGDAGGQLHGLGQHRARRADPRGPARCHRLVGVDPLRGQQRGGGTLPSHALGSSRLLAASGGTPSSAKGARSRVPSSINTRST